MNFRTTLAILLVFVLLLGVWWFVTKRKVPDEDTATTTLGQRYGVTPEAVQRISLSYRDPALVPLSLERQQGDWRLTEPMQADAEDAKVASMLRDLIGKKLKRTLNVESLAPYGLDAPRIRVTLWKSELWKSESTPALTVLVGDKAVGYSAYVKIETSDQVHTVESSILDDLTKSPSDLRERRLLVFTEPAVQQIRLSLPERETIVISRQGEAWQMEQPVQALADAEQVKRLIDIVRTLRAQTFESEQASSENAYGFPGLTFAVVLEDGIHRLHLGDPIPGTDRVAASVEGRTTVYGVDALVRKQLDRTVSDLRDKRVLDFQRADATRFEIERGGTVLVCEKERGDDWFLRQPVQMKADAGAVNEFLFSLDALRARDFVDDHPTDLSRYGLAPPQVTIRVFTTGAEPAARLLLGKVEGDRVMARGKRASVVSIDDTLLKTVRAGVAAFRDRLFWEWDTSDVRRISLTHASAQLECVRQGTTWQITAPIQQRASFSAVEALLKSVATLRVERYETDLPPEAMEPIQLRLSLTFADGSTHTLRIGDQLPSGDLAAQADEEPMILILPESVLKELSKTAEDLREKAL